ncbi:hypothetical protein [Vitreimonas flagellata]|uniref:hypothetical protein n=1 Tax=Vitreimonas flagellata TaxID=2560861 RepID=UPI0010751B87|nr:hypothetical protein [Vitreimonas flagellata]
MVQSNDHRPIAETGWTLDAEAQAQMRRLRSWFAFRFCPGALVVSLVLWATLESPFFQWAVFVTAAIWSIGLLLYVERRKEFGQVFAWLWREAGEALDALRHWNAIAHAKKIAASDAHPAYWSTPAQHEDQARYRRTWEALALKPDRTDAEDATLVQILRGLRAFGDDPLADPPSLTRPSRFAAVLPQVGPLRFWPLYAALGLVGALGVQSVRVERLKHDANEARRVAQGWAMRAGVAEQNLATMQAARDEAITRSIEEELESATLMDERDDLRARLQQRERSRRHEAQARRPGDVVDYSERLRELSEPASVPSVSATPAAGDPAG